MPKYRKVRILGGGAFGEVWEGARDDTGEPVAIKLLTKLDDDSRTRFAREADILARCRSCEQIVDILDYFPTENPPAIVMDYCPHGSLEDHLKKSGTLRWEIALWFTREMAKALRFIHDLGGFHRDVKPANMLIKSLDETQWVVKLSDFGLGRDPNLTSNMTHEARGTIPYMAPELFLGGSFTANCDIYALGVSFIHMVTGVPNRELAISMFFEPTVRVLLDTMLAKDPAQRPTATELIASINEILKERRSRNDQLALVTKTTERNDLAGILIGGLVVAGIVGLIAALFDANAAGRTGRHSGGKPLEAREVDLFECPTVSIFLYTLRKDAPWKVRE
jgi:serine/threonine protein kinase